MENYFHLNMDRRAVNQISALGLAHCGDAVFELLVRSFLCASGKALNGNLHRATVDLGMLPLLTEEELAFYKRGRNAHVHQVPKNATYAQYARATGLECLFGALYLTGQLDRLNELFILTMEESHAI